MAVYLLQKIQNIPGEPDKIWSFFADPANLPLITPPSMRFHILSPAEGDRIYAGQLLAYKLRPLPLVRVYWLTEITQVHEGHYFVDEQRRGPYSFWHHQHYFKEIPGGVEMTDMVHYEVPLGFLGSLANVLLVRRKLEAIFRYRRERVEEFFGKFQGA